MMLLPIRDNAEFSTSISVNKAFVPTPAAQRFIEFVQEEFKDDKMGQ